MKSYEDFVPSFPALIDAVISSKEIVSKYFVEGRAAEVFDLKGDKSAVTKADLEINLYLSKVIKSLYPEIAILSEENTSEENSVVLEKDDFFIIDPIDGTSSFVAGNREFSINLALKQKEKFTFGIIYLPIDDVLYYAENDFLIRFNNASRTKNLVSRIIAKDREDMLGKLVVIATRRADELEQIKNNLQNTSYELDFVSFSSSVKFCYLAEGKADIYYRAAKIKLWDVAAGFAICQAAGLEIVDYENQDLIKKILDKSYLRSLGEKDFRIDQFIIKRAKINLF